MNDDSTDEAITLDEYAARHGEGDRFYEWLEPSKVVSNLWSDLDFGVHYARHKGEAAEVDKIEALSAALREFAPFGWQEGDSDLDPASFSIPTDVLALLDKYMEGELVAIPLTIPGKPGEPDRVFPKVRKRVNGWWQTGLGEDHPFVREYAERYPEQAKSAGA